MAAAVVVAYPCTDDHVAVEVIKVGDFLAVIGLVTPVDAVACHAVVEVAHAEGGEEAHQLERRIVARLRDHALVALAVAAHKGGQRVGMLVDAFEEAWCDDEERAGAVVGIAIALLVYLHEVLVVVRQTGQFDLLEDEGAAGVVQHSVGRNGTNATVDMCILLAPAYLLVVEDAGGDDESFLHDAVQLSRRHPPSTFTFHL